MPFGSVPGRQTMNRSAVFGRHTVPALPGCAHYRHFMLPSKATRERVGYGLQAPEVGRIVMSDDTDTHSIPYSGPLFSTLTGRVLSSPTRSCLRERLHMLSDPRRSSYSAHQTGGSATRMHGAKVGNVVRATAWGYTWVRPRLALVG